MNLTLFLDVYQFDDIYAGTERSSEWLSAKQNMSIKDVLWWQVLNDMSLGAVKVFYDTRSGEERVAKLSVYITTEGGGSNLRSYFVIPWGSVHILHNDLGGVQYIKWLYLLRWCTSGRGCDNENITDYVDMGRGLQNLIYFLLKARYALHFQTKCLYF